MESETNKQIREILEKYGVDHTKVVGEFNLIGHLKTIADEHAERELKRKTDILLSIR